MKFFSLKKFSKFGFALAVVHLAILVSFSIYMRTTEPVAQLDMLWIFWFIVDFPVSAVIFLFIPLGAGDWEIAYIPHYFTHGFLGTVWWYFLGQRIWFVLKRSKTRP